MLVVRLVDPMGLLDYVRSQSIEAAEEEGRYIPEPNIPERQKRQKIEGARAGGMAWRLRRPRKKCVGLTCEGLIPRADAVCATLEGSWGPVFSGKLIDDETAAYFMNFVVSVPDRFSWENPGDIVEQWILRTTDSMPGPDGIPHAAWRVVANKAALPIREALQGFARGYI